MQIIKTLVDKINDELDDANKYIKCAYRVKDEDTKLADTFYDLSLEEMKHMTLLHDQVVRIINDYKREHEVPEVMQMLYNDEHEKIIKRAAKIKAKQEGFKK